MESLIRNVWDLEADKRHSLEVVLGQQLQDNQQILIRVLTPGVEPDAATKQQAFADMRTISEKAAQHRQSLGVSEDEADRIVDEAMAHVRHPKGQ